MGIQLIDHTESRRSAELKYMFLENKSLNSKVMNTFGYNGGGAIKETCFAGIVKRKTAEARKKEGSIKKLVEE